VGAAGDTHTQKDAVFRLWWPLLRALSAAVADARLKVCVCVCVYVCVYVCGCM
jgi:hypothetical protein